MAGHDRLSTDLSGSLVVAGTGIGFARLTDEARAAIAGADEVLFLVPDPFSAAVVQQLNPRSRSLAHCYRDGVPHRSAYAQMVEEILAPVRAGRDVCAVFYGHPGVFVFPSHEAVQVARGEGFDARMLPGVSAEDCLFADLGVDPARAGCQSYEATDFLRRRPLVEPTAALVLWQVGVVGADRHSDEPRAPALRPLIELLLELYPAEHEVIVYQASSYPGIEPLVRRLPLGGVDERAVTPWATLYVPPLSSA